MPHCPAAGGDGLAASGRAEGVSPLPPATPSWPKPGVASAPRGAHWEGGRSPGPFSRLPFHFGWKPWAGQPPGREPWGRGAVPMALGLENRGAWGTPAPRRERAVTCVAPARARGARRH